MAFDPVSIAIFVALNIAQALLSRRNIETGKVDELEVDTGSYGAELPPIIGQQIVVGKTIWIANGQIREVKKKKKILAGIGGSVTTYKYFGTWAVAFTSNRVGLDGLWINDEKAAETIPRTDAGGNIFRALINRLLGGRSYYDFYDGADQQPQDGTMIDVDGVANTPSYPGISYMVFKDVELTKYGNQIPTVKAQVVEIPDVEHYVVDLDLPSERLSEPSVDEYGRIWVHVNRSPQQLLNQPIDGSAPPTFIDLPGINIDAFFQPTAFYHRPIDAVLIGADGNSQVYAFDANTGNILNSAPAGGFFHEYNSYDGEYYTATDIVGTVREYQLPNMTQISTPYSVPTLVDEGTLSKHAAIRLNGVGDAFVYTKLNSNTFLGIKLLTLNKIDLTVLYGQNEIPAIGYSKSRKYIILSGSKGTAAFNHDGDLIWHNSRSVFSAAAELRRLTLTDEKYLWLPGLSPSAILKIDLNTGEIVREISDYNASGLVVSTLYVPAYHAVLIRTNAVNEYQTIFLDRPPATETTVGHAVDVLAQRSNFPMNRLDTSEADEIIIGLNPGGSKARSVIEQLLHITGYDAVEESGTLKIKARGKAASITVDERDMAVSEDIDSEDDQGLIRRVQSSNADAPWKIELDFADSDGDFEGNVVSARRDVNTVRTREILTVSAGLALTVDMAKRFVTRLLSERWTALSIVFFNLPSVKYGLISAGDVINVPDGDDTLKVRVLKCVMSAGIISIEGVVADPTGADINIIGQARGVPNTSLLTLTDAKIEMIDSNLPADTVENLDGYGLYSRAIILDRNVELTEYFKSEDDGETYESEGFAEVQPEYALMQTILADVADVTAADYASEIEAKFKTPPSSATIQALAADELLNLCFVKVGNEWELIQFLDVTSLGDDVYRLSGLLRGRRGTEHLIGEHTDASIIALYNGAYQRAGDFDDYQVERFFIAIDDENAEDFIETLETSNALGLRPYSLVNLDYEQTNAGGVDATLTGTRRTRIGGTDFESGDVPLSETSEAYEIDIFDGGTFKRTLTSITPSVVYTSGHQIDDLGATHQPFTAVWYQMSDEVGRGVPSEIYVENTAP